MSMIKLKIVFRSMISSSMLLTCLIVLSLIDLSFAQSSDKLLNDGNKLYKQKKYDEAKKWLAKSMSHGGDKSGSG